MGILNRIDAITGSNAPVDPTAEDGSFSRGLRSGVTAAGGQMRALAGGVGEALGADEFAQRQYAAAKQAQELSAQQAPVINSYHQVLDAPDFGTGLRRAGSYVAGLAGSSLPVMGAGIGAGAVTALTGGGAVPAFLAATGAVAPFEVGGAIERQQADPTIAALPAGQRLGSAAVEGVGRAALMNAVPAAVGGRLLGAGMRQGAGSMGGAVAENLAEGVAGNAAAGYSGEKLSQGMASNLNPNRDTSGDDAAATEAAVGGGALGLPFAGAGIAGHAVRAPGRGLGSLVDGAKDLAGKAVDGAKDLAGDIKAKKDEYLNKEETHPAVAKVEEVTDAATKSAETGTEDGITALSAKSPEDAEQASNVARFMTEAVITRTTKAREWATELLKNADLPDELKGKLQAALDNPKESKGQAFVAAVKFLTANKTDWAGLGRVAAKVPGMAKSGIDDFIAARRAKADDAELSQLAEGIDVPAQKAGPKATEQVLKDQEGQVLQKSRKWAIDLLKDGELTPEEKDHIGAQLDILNSKEPTMSAVYAVAKAKLGDSTLRNGKVAIDSLSKYATDAWAKVKPKGIKSEASEGLRKAIVEEVMPYLENPRMLGSGKDAAGNLHSTNNRLANDGAINTLADSLRDVIAYAKEGGKIDDAAIDNLRKIFGGNATRVLSKVAELATNDDGRVLAEINRVIKNETLGADRAKFLEKTIGPDKMTELDLTHSELEKLGKLVEAHMDESAYANMGAAKREIEKHHFQSFMKEHFGEDTTNTILNAYSKRAKTAKPSDMEGRARMTDEEMADDELRTGELSETDPEFRETDFNETAQKPIHYGAADNSELVMNRDTHRAIYNNSSPAERLLDQARRENLDMNPQFISAADMDQNHPAIKATKAKLEEKLAKDQAAHETKQQKEMDERTDAIHRDLIEKTERRVSTGKTLTEEKIASLRAEAEAIAEGMVPRKPFKPTAEHDINNYGMVVAEGTKHETVLHPDEFKAMQALKTTELEGKSRIDTKKGAVDAFKVVKVMYEKMGMSGDDKTSMHRLSRAFTDGMAAVAQYTGTKDMKIPDTTVVARWGGKDITVKDLKKLQHRPEDPQWMHGLTDEQINRRLGQEDFFEGMGRAELMQKAIVPVTNKIEAKAQEVIDGWIESKNFPTKAKVAALYKMLSKTPLGEALKLAESAYYKQDKRSRGDMALDVEGSVDGGIYDMHKLERRELEGQALNAEKMFGKGKVDRFAALAQEKMNAMAWMTEGSEHAPLGQRIRNGRRYVENIGKRIEETENNAERATLAERAKAAQKLLDKLEAQEQRELNDPGLGSGRTDLTPDRNIHEADAVMGDSLGQRFAAQKNVDNLNLQSNKRTNADDPAKVYARFQERVEEIKQSKSPAAKKLAADIEALDRLASVREGGAYKKAEYEGGTIKKYVDGKFVMDEKDRSPFHNDVIMRKDISGLAPHIAKLMAKYKDALAKLPEEKPKEGDGDGASIWSAGAKKSDPAAQYNLQRAGVGKTVPPDLRVAVAEHVEKVLGPDMEVRFERMLHEGEYVRKERGPLLPVQEIIRISMHSLDPMGTAFHESLHGLLARMRDTGLHEANQVLFKAASTAHVMKQLRELLKNSPEALKQIETDVEERAAYMYQFSRLKDPATGQPMLRIGDGAKGVIGRIADAIRGALGIWSNDARAIEIMDHFQRGDTQKLSGNRSAVASALLERGTNRTFEGIKKTLRPLAKISENILGAGDAVIRDMENPAFTKMANMILSRTTGTEADPGFITAQGAKFRQTMNDMVQKFSDMGVNSRHLAEAIEALQTKTQAPSAEGRLAQTVVRRTLDGMFTYLNDAGVKVNDLGFQKDYFPVVWDTDYISRHAPEFRTMLEKYVIQGDFKGNPDALLSKLIANNGNEFGIETNVPGMMALRDRVLDFIDPLDRAPFLQKDLLGTMNSYVMQATRRAEWTRRFGDKGETMIALVKEAKEKYGATPEQVEKFYQYVKGVDGTLGDHIDPKLRRMFGNMIVYQNVRLLPLAVFSMAVDPAGIMVRGGTIKDAFTAFKRGIAEIPRGFTDKPKDEWYKLAETMGVIENSALVHALGSSYSQGMVGDTGRKINDVFFRYNLVEQMNTSMRVAAVPAALGFFAKHADGKASVHSTRWLAELGYKPGEMIMGADGKPLMTYKQFKDHGLSDADAAAHAVKMTGAVNKWVDGAILRPNAAHKPIWMNDPHFALLAHLKQFVYSFNETILKRVLNETKHGNYTPAYVLASYVPIMMAADALKGALITGGGVPQYKDGWDLEDYIGNGMQRAGLFGVGQFGLDALHDVQHGGIGVTSLMGPAIEQLADGVKTMGGRESVGSFALDALPANILMKSMLGSNNKADPVFAE